MGSPQNTHRLGHIWDAFVTWHTTLDSPRPEIAEGLRMAVGIFVPILIGRPLDHISWGVLVALTTFWGLLCDTRGSYRHKGFSNAVSGDAINAAVLLGARGRRSSSTHLAGLL